MPYDPIPVTERLATRAEWNAATPVQKRRMLIYALEHLHLVESFKWDFGTIFLESKCGSVGCAIGVVRQLWEKDAYAIGLAERLDVDLRVFSPRPKAGNLRWPYSTLTYSDITPWMVADRLRATLPTSE